jgi:CDP-4-dehydro-6-deoxyglucose reductase, E1
MASGEAPVLYPLCDNRLEPEDAEAMIGLIRSGAQLSMGPQTKLFEQEMGAFLQLGGGRAAAPLPVFVNSGSSANLLAVVAACHPDRVGRRWRRGDCILVPSLCWSTTVTPLLLMGLVPLLVDVEPDTLQMSLEHAAALIAQHGTRVSGIMLVHVLGGCVNMHELMALVEDHELVLIEDACEAMGNSFGGRRLGTWGHFGTFSTFYSHHMTSVEGGFVIARTDADAQCVIRMRAHGWTRNMDPDAAAAIHAPHRGDLPDTRFLFVDMGFNVRPTDICAALGRAQLRRLEAMNACRKANFAAFQECLRASGTDITTMTVIEGADVAPLALPLVFSHDADMEAIRDALTAAGIEHRPVISGNFARQPIMQCAADWIDCEDSFAEVPLSDHVNVDHVHYNGLYIGLHGRLLEPATVAQVVQRIVAAATE